MALYLFENRRTPFERPPCLEVNPSGKFTKGMISQEGFRYIEIANKESKHIGDCT